MASASSSTPLDLQSKKWDAFISLRGKDISSDFLSHLSKALNEKQINAFIDDKLDKEEEISESFLKIIEDSYVAVVIFSENYADSPWCLDELVKIVECREKSGQVVLPAFYKADPTDVQELRGNFGKAFHKLKVERQDCLHKVDGWSHALQEISNLSGCDSRNIKMESELIEEILKGVFDKLCRMSSNNLSNDNLVGIDLRVKKVESLLQIGLVNEKRIIGIWGMGGIGKTIIADAIFKRNMAQFDSYCFVMNVTEEIKNQALIMLRDKIISQLLRREGLDIKTPRLPPFIRRRLQMKKVIIVFDDVNDLRHLEFLLGECDLFNKGSRIIVTSRDRQVLENICPIENIYEVEKLTNQEALQLFCLYAFKKNHPREGYDTLSRKVITYAQGNPLVVKVLGSNLYDKNMEEWESELKKLNNIPDMKLQKVLKTSYDGLDDDEQSMFLEIACLLKLEHKHDIERILEGCGFFPKIGISRLIDKSLISISNRGIVNIHKWLQQMGRDIVHKESKLPEGRSRLWNSEDISHVLTKDKGTEKVEAVFVDMFEIEDLEISSTAFKEMYNLRFLKFYNSWVPKGKFHLPNGLEFLPRKLRYLQWDDYPLKSLPLKFCPNYLVDLRMPGSQLKQLWIGGDKKLPNLKFMDLSDSLHLIRIPDLSGAFNLEFLRLTGCDSLVEIPSSTQYLSKLADLFLDGCISLRSLPSCLHLKNLNYLVLTGCSKLRECPEIPCNIKFLILDKSAIEELPSSIEHCSQLVSLSLGHCTRLVSLPQSISNLKFLKGLVVNDCLNLKELPDSFGYLESLQHLNLERSGIKALPSSMNQLISLELLFCRGCDGLTKLPLLTGLSCLRTLDLGNCGILEIPDTIGSLESLEILYLDGNNFESLPTSINQLSNLEMFDLTDCKRLRFLPVLPCSKEIVISNCCSLELASTSFLSSLDHRSWDRELDFTNCINLDSKTIMDQVLMESHLVKQVSVALRVPGVELPQGMRYQNENGSSLSNIRLDDTRLIGFSLCVVVDKSNFQMSQVKCRADFKDESGYGCNSNFYSFNWVSDDLEMQHVYLWYSNVDFKEHFTEASFQFYIEHYNEIDEGGVMNSKIDNKGIVKCGMHPVYEDDFVGRDKKRRRNDDQNEDNQDEEDQPSLEKGRKR